MTMRGSDGGNLLMQSYLSFIFNENSFRIYFLPGSVLSSISAADKSNDASMVKINSKK